MADKTIVKSLSQQTVKAEKKPVPEKKQGSEKLESIGKYKIVSKIAEGGMGSVYKAIHPSLKSHVIIKKLTLRGSSSTFRERFKQEAKILQGLTSENVVKVFDHFTEGRSDYIVMEYVDGMSLDKLIRKQVAIPSQMALLIVRDACLGLRSAHRKGIVHRDIKPGNILISKKGEIKLADFGIAGKEKEDSQESTGAAKDVLLDMGSVNTQVGASMGTPAYMSPEQMEDSSSVDQRADIYSMGVMLYEMVTGSKPFPEELSKKNLEKIKKGKYIPPQKLDSTIPKIVRKLIAKMMKSKASRRYQSIDPVIKKINRYLKQYDVHAIRVAMVQSLVTPSLFKYPVFKPKRYVERKLFGGILAAALIAALGYFAWNQGFFHYTVLRKIYTPVSLTLELPATASADADLPARAFFFIDDNDSLPEVENTRRIFTATGQTSATATTKLYKTKDVFLKPGLYRIKIAEGPYVWWSRITVGEAAQEIKLDFLKDESRKLKIHSHVIDAATGQDITDLSQCLILTEKGWQNLSLVESRLETGTVHKIIVRSEGYEDQYFSLRIDWYQDELYINAALNKEN